MPVDVVGVVVVGSDTLKPSMRNGTRLPVRTEAGGVVPLVYREMRACRRVSTAAPKPMDENAQ
jgi:hypothetical protein